MMRRPDWRERLALFLEQRRSTPFRWGASDCCLTVADAVEAMTAQDFAKPLRGYSNRFGALRALVRAGFVSLTDYLDAHLPRTETPLAGDVVMAPDGVLGALMIADGRGGVWGQDEAGVARFALPATLIAWTV